MAEKKSSSKATKRRTGAAAESVTGRKASDRVSSSAGKRNMSSGTGTASEKNRAADKQTVLILRIMTAVLFLLGLTLFFSLCGLFGSFGQGLSRIFRGYVGGAAWLAAMFFCIGGIRLQRDVKLYCVQWKILVGFFDVVAVAALCHVGHLDDAEFVVSGAWDRVKVFFSEGSEGHGGGAFGGYLAYFMSGVGVFGTVFLLVLGLLFGVFYFLGLSPRTLLTEAGHLYYSAKNRIAKIQARRAAAKAEAEPIREAERERQQKREQEVARMREEDLARRKNAAAQKEETRRMRAVMRREGTPVSGKAFERHPAPLTKEEAAEQVAALQAAFLAEEKAAEEQKKKEQEEAVAAAAHAEQTVTAPAAATVSDPDHVNLKEIFREKKDTTTPEADREQNSPLFDSLERERTVQEAEWELPTTSIVTGQPVADDVLPEPSVIAQAQEPVEAAENVVPRVKTESVTTAAEVPQTEEPRDTGMTAEEEAEAMEETLQDAHHPDSAAGTETAAAVEVPYRFPETSLLQKDTADINEDLSEELQEKGKLLVETLESFHVKAKVINIACGPAVTRFELQPERGTRVRSVENLVDDIALSMAAEGVRIEAPIPGKSAVGVEIPNRTVNTVYLRSLIETDAFRNAKSRLTTCLGMDVAGSPMFLDIAKMPHLLICGATGMGKSVCINSLLVSLLYKARPDEVRLILIDPKKVELNLYNGIPHLLVPVISEPKKAAGSLHWAVNEMERRFELIEQVGVRNLEGYNAIVRGDPEKEILPQIVIVIDELADLMMTAPDDVETSICRLAQKARAAGMHLVIGTQRPSTDVITGLIKANIPSRIAFRVSSLVDSRVVLDMGGAEKLIGRGDMLYAPVGMPKPVRVQGAFVSDSELDGIVNFLKKNAGQVEYSDTIMDSIDKEAAACGQKKSAASADTEEDGDGGEDDALLYQALEIAVDAGKISTSLIQRKLSLGYGRAAKLIDRMEAKHYVSAPEGQKPRTVLISREAFQEMMMQKRDS